MSLCFSRSLMCVVLAALALVSQTACTPVGIAAGAGATAGIAATREGGISGAASDLKIRAEINDLWFRTNTDIFRKLNLTVDQGRVLITGVVQNPEHRVEAVRLAWQPKGVKQVINEIRVAEGEGVPGYVRDSWISAQLRTKLTLDRDVQALNYSIETVQGIVYLMGVARSQEELNRVIETARTISNVRQVISYVKLIGEPIQTSATGASAGSAAGAAAVAAPAATSGAVPASPAPVAADPTGVTSPAPVTIIPMTP